jgi:hypothetical protein
MKWEVGCYVIVNGQLWVVHNVDDFGATIYRGQGT